MASTASGKLVLAVSTQIFSLLAVLLLPPLHSLGALSLLPPPAALWEWRLVEARTVLPSLWQRRRSRPPRRGLYTRENRSWMPHLLPDDRPATHLRENAKTCLSLFQPDLAPASGIARPALVDSDTSARSVMPPIITLLVRGANEWTRLITPYRLMSSPVNWLSLVFLITCCMAYALAPSFVFLVLSRLRINPLLSISTSSPRLLLNKFPFVACLAPSPGSN